MNNCIEKKMMVAVDVALDPDAQSVLHPGESVLRIGEYYQEIFPLAISQLWAWLGTGRRDHRDQCYRLTAALRSVRDAARQTS